MKKLNLIALPVLIALFFAVNLASNAFFTGTKLDLTEAKLFTLSEGTKNILGAMEEPVTLRLFYSSTLAKEKAPVLERYAQRVTELLDEYASYAEGKLTIIQVDPQPFSEEEDMAVEFGMKGVPVTSAGELVYFGVAASNSIDDQEVIPFIELPREDFLEYDFTKLIYGLANPQKHKVGLLTSLPIEGGAPNPMDPRGQAAQPWFFLSQVETAFEVETIERGATDLPADINLLLLIHPKKLDPQMLFAIDQFVLGGGKVVAFMDPHCEADTEEINPQDQMSAFSANRTSDLGPLPLAWGFELVGEKIAADKGNAHRVRMPDGEMPYVAWLDLNEQNLGAGDDASGKDPVISMLKKINMATAGILKPTADATTKFEPMIQTGTESMQVDRIRAAMRPDPKGMLDSFVSEDTPLTLAARISGPIKSAYPDGPPEVPVKEGEPVLPEFTPDGGWKKEGTGQIIVIADADMLQDRWWVNLQNFFGQMIASPTSNNSDLLINSLENLTGNSDMISLRSRQGFERPFTRVDAIRQQSEERFREEETKLQLDLNEAETRLAELQSKKEGAVSSLIITPEERDEIEKFQAKRIETRKQLREVKFSLKKDIDALGTSIKFYNFLIPILVALLGLGFWIVRSNTKAA